MNELEGARQIAAGELPSPTTCSSSTLWAMRITGTGRAVRAGGETCWRDPNIWLTAETLARCAGLPVLIEHPPGGSLNSAEFQDRNVGNVLFPYVANQQGILNDQDPNNLGPDVWAVVRIYDDATNIMLREQVLSTSPAVVFKPSDGNTTIPTAAGYILVEGTPSLLDHIAIVPAGVWDEDGPDGIRNDTLKGNTTMADEQSTTPDEEGKAIPGDVLDKFMQTMEAMGKRMDAMEAAVLDATKRRDTAEPSDLEDGLTAEEKRRGETQRLVADSKPPIDHVARQAAERQDAADKAAVQARADAVYQDLGNRAPAPMMGETLQAYRTRMARGLQRHSSGFAKVDLGDLHGDAFAAIEDKIYADAKIAARTPEVTPGVLREIVKVDPHTGRRTIEFYGTETFIHHMNRPPRYATINTKPNG